MSKLPIGRHSLNVRCFIAYKLQGPLDRTIADVVKFRLLRSSQCSITKLGVLCFVPFILCWKRPQKFCSKKSFWSTISQTLKIGRKWDNSLRISSKKILTPCWAKDLSEFYGSRSDSVSFRLAKICTSLPAGLVGRVSSQSKMSSFMKFVVMLLCDWQQQPYGAQQTGSYILCKKRSYDSDRSFV